MTEREGSGLARARQERPWLYAFVRVVLVVLALVVLFNVVLPDLVSAIPFPVCPTSPICPAGLAG